MDLLQEWHLHQQEMPLEHVHELSASYMALLEWFEEQQHVVVL